MLICHTTSAQVHACPYPANYTYIATGCYYYNIGFLFYPSSVHVHVLSMHSYYSLANTQVQCQEGIADYSLANTQVQCQEGIADDFNHQPSF